MRIDEYKTLVSERDPWPGSIGDSCANTCRMLILNPSYASQLDTSVFITKDGYLRHPTAPEKTADKGENWREPNFSCDQAIPLVLATGIKGNWYEIPGTTTVVQPGLWFAVRGMWQLFAVTLVIQGWIFKWPWRWSDATQSWERSENSSADYLNYFVSFIALRRKGIKWPMRFMDSRTPAKIQSYCSNEPNGEWVFEAYRLNFPPT